MSLRKIKVSDSLFKMECLTKVDDIYYDEEKGLILAPIMTVEMYERWYGKIEEVKDEGEK